MKKTCQPIFAALVCAGLNAATIDQVIVRQQWPWSTDVKVEYKLSGVTSPVDISVKAYNGAVELPAANLAAAMTGDRYGIAEDGVGTIMIDPVKAFGTSKVALANFRVELEIAQSAANINDPLYKIIRISDGDCTDVSRADLMNGKYGTYETDYRKIYSTYTNLENVIIWTGVTNDIAYKTTHIVMRKIECKNIQWTMGDPSTLLHYSSVAPECQVVLTNNFWISVFPLTIGHWKAAGLGTSGRSDGGGVYPANTNECAIQANSMLAVRGGVPGAGTTYKKWPDNRHSVYSSSFLGKLRSKTKYDFELPTEAQWEFAARGGVYSLHLYTGEITDTDAKLSDSLGRIAWFDGNSKVGSTVYKKPVGRLKPNAYGLYDMLGMLAEYMLNKNYDYDTENVAYEPEGTTDGSSPMFRSYTYVNSHTGLRIGNRRLSLSSNAFATGVRVILPDLPGLVYPDWDKQ